MQEVQMSDPVEVLDFWLDEIGPDKWYTGGDSVDHRITERFAELWAALDAGHLDHWVDGAAGTLAYIIVADQFSRNIHRGSAAAFANDARARDAATAAIAAGWDMDAPEPERQFFYMPFEHSENMADQNRAVDLMVERVPSEPDMALHARAHREIISRFGRFPFRNTALGRDNTEDEDRFMADGAYGSVVRTLKTRHAPDA
jgi:uncharacterized protein (DUF924 family)